MKELLEKARTDFEKKFAQTPEQAGYKVVNIYENQVVFSTNQKVFDAFVQAQIVIRKAIWLLVICIALMFLSIICFLANLFCQITLVGGISFAATIIFSLFAGYINSHQHIAYNNLEKVYLEKGALLFYDGQCFEDLSPQNTRPEIAFF